MVIDVVGDAGFAAKEGSFFLGLEDLGACEEAARGNAVLDEGCVVGAAAEFGRNVGDIPALVELLKVFLEDIGSIGADEVESRSVAVVDSVDVVGAGNLFSRQRLSTLSLTSSLEKEGQTMSKLR